MILDMMLCFCKQNFVGRNWLVKLQGAPPKKKVLRWPDDT